MLVVSKLAKSTQFMLAIQVHSLKGTKTSVELTPPPKIGCQLPVTPFSSGFLQRPVAYIAEASGPLSLRQLASNGRMQCGWHPGAAAGDLGEIPTVFHVKSSNDAADGSEIL